MNPLFSIVIPAFNAEATLVGSVESALRQSLSKEKYEIIIIDDGSTDSTYVLMQSLQQAADNIKIFRNPSNICLGATRNRGIELASGDYITFLDADDCLRSDALECFFDALNDELDIIYADIVKINEYGDTLASLIRNKDTRLLLKTQLRGTPSFCACAALYKKSFLEKNVIRFTTGVFYEDIEFSIRCALYVKNFKLLDHVLYYWKVRQDSITGTISHKKIEDAIQVWVKIYYLLEQHGLINTYFTDWKGAVVKFFQLTATRCRYFADDADALLAFFAERILQSPLLSAKGVTPECLEPVIRECAKHSLRLVSITDLPKLAEAAAGAVVLMGNVDYHVRQLVVIARKLQLNGVKCVVIDASPSHRHLPGRILKQAEADTFSDIPFFFLETDVVYPLFFNAKAYVFTADWHLFRTLIIKLKERNIPVIAFYEGITDDLLVEPPAPPRMMDLHYRHADYLMIPGEYYSSIYSKHNPVVTGLPTIREKLLEEVRFPESPRVLINVNFTFGVLEDKRNQFLTTALDACNVLSLPYIIAQHPADTADLSILRPSDMGVYENLRRSTVLISRFSTCILEALAMGKPVIYHNPHGEKFPKFQEKPMGAFLVSTSTESLIEALENVLADVKAGVDFRKRAAPYLQHHANIFAAKLPEDYALDTIRNILDADASNYEKRILFFAAQAPMLQKKSSPALPKADAKTPSRRYMHLGMCYKNSSIIKKALTLLLLDKRTLKEDIVKMFRAKKTSIHLACK
jgi:glycosyltransferase involved in cell wall biosynthesis